MVLTFLWRGGGGHLNPGVLIEYGEFHDFKIEFVRERQDEKCCAKWKLKVVAVFSSEK